VGRLRPDLLQDCFCGAVTVGERGQVVIPAEARKRMRVQPGDKLLVMLHPTHSGLFLFKIEEVREMMSLVLESLARFENEDAADASVEKESE